MNNTNNNLNVLSDYEYLKQLLKKCSKEKFELIKEIVTKLHQAPIV